MDSFAHKQHHCRGSEELAIRKTARFRAFRDTPSDSERLRTAPRIPSYSELLQSTPSCYSKLLELSEPHQALRGRPTPSYSKLLPKHSELLLRATRALRATPSSPSGRRPRTPSCSERKSELLQCFRATPSNSEHSELLRAAPNTPRCSEHSELLRAKMQSELLLTTPSTPSCSEHSELLRAKMPSELPPTTPSTPSCSEHSEPLILRAQSLPSPELQALLSPYNSAACGQRSPLLRGSEVKNSELWQQIACASAVCGELGLPSLERARTSAQ